MAKFLVFGGGLGNQIFEYAYYRYLQNLYPEQKYYGFYKIRLKGHNGLEINKRFNLKLPKENVLSNFCVYILYAIKKILPKLYIFDLDIYKFNEGAILHNALKIDKRVIPSDNNWITFRITEKDLNKQNAEVLKLIKESQSCLIHVRRGDYITGKWAYAYAGCCPKDYYEKAISDIKAKIPNVQFFCFSDDIEWMRSNLDLPQNSVFINWNKGEESFIDLFLMSKCKNSIMANSTFSYWGSILGEKKQNVYYPSKWINGNMPDIFFDNWKTF